MKTRRKRNDPTYPKVDDWVRVDNPQMFIRCGYPLWIKDVKDEIRANHLRDIQDFIRKIILDKQDGEPDFISRSIRQKFHSSSEKKIIEALAYEKMKAEGFGGRDRTIHTEFKKELQGKIFQVVGTKQVVTGKYVPAYRDNDSYYSESWEPPYLDGQKSHRLLILSDSEYREAWPSTYKIITRYDDRSKRIEDCHVTKVDIKELEAKNELVATN